jgi:hypothetical protein
MKDEVETDAETGFIDTKPLFVMVLVGHDFKRAVTRLFNLMKKERFTFLANFVQEITIDWVRAKLIDINEFYLD